MPTVRPRGDKFQAIVRVKKHGQIVHQESKMFEREALAWDWAETLEKRIKAVGTEQRKLTLQTLGDLMNQYRLVRSGVKPLSRSAENELDILCRHLKSVTLSSLTSATFTQFALKRKADGAGPVTILHNLSTLRSILNSAKPMFNIDVNGEAVADSIKALKQLGAVDRSESRTRRVSQEEIDRLHVEFKRISAFPGTVIPMNTYLDLAIALPRRRSELCKMKWVDYDKRSKVITLRDTKNPTRPRTETIPVPPKAAAIIDNLPVIDECIFPYNPDSVSAAFERACERCGIADLHLHDLRHEGISRLFELGLDIPEVALISGHMSWTMLRRYTHLKPEQVLEKLNAGSQETQKAPTQPKRTRARNGSDADRQDA